MIGINDARQRRGRMSRWISEMHTSKAYSFLRHVFQRHLLSSLNHVVVVLTSNRLSVLSRLLSFAGMKGGEGEGAL